MDTKEQFTKEISTLFETVKIQAVEYSNAFENFRMMTNEFKELNDRISAFKIEFKEDVEKRIEQYDKKMQEFTEYVTIEYTKLKEEYKLVKNINDLHIEQEKITKNLKSFLKESESKFNEIYSSAEEYKKDIQNIRDKALADTEKLLKELTKSFEDRISTSIDEKTDKIKEEIIFRQRKIEGLLKNNESELKALQREFTINKNDFNEKIDEIKKTLDDRDPAVKSDGKSLIDDMNLKIEELNAGLHSVEHDVSSLSQLVDKNLKTSGKFSSGSDNSAFLSLNKKIKNFEEDMNEQDKRVKTSYIIAFMSIVFALISILLTFI